MRVRKINNEKNINFDAKIMLNDRTLLNNSAIRNHYTQLDTMFNENRTVKALNLTSEFIKNKIFCRYFSKPTGTFSKIFANIQYKFMIFLRKFSDRIFVFNNKKSVDDLLTFFSGIKEDSPQYIEELAKIGNSVENKFIEINSEDKVLERLAKSGEPSIFVLNHPNYHRDKFVYVIINSILSRFYTSLGKQNSCPRPKILVSRNMLKVIHSKIGAIYKKLGMVPIDASLENKDKNYNLGTMKKIIQEYMENKVNLFLFPEGNNSSFIDKPFEERIQSGVADLVNVLMRLVKKVRIVPIGINYNDEKNSMGKIFVGEPLLFERIQNQILCNSSPINSSQKEFSHSANIKSILNIICAKLKFGLEAAKTQR